MAGNCSSLHSSRQKGLVLFIALVMLLVLTVIGVSSIQTSSLQGIMVRNSRDHLLAFHSAEAALSAGEQRLNALTDFDDFATAGDETLPEPSVLRTSEVWESSSFWSGSSSAEVLSITSNSQTNLSEAPRYVIERLSTLFVEENPAVIPEGYLSPPPEEVAVFRVTARGVGASSGSVVILQSTYGVLVNR